jgi:hypothetical protein
MPQKPQRDTAAGPGREAGKPESCPHPPSPERAKGVNDQPENWNWQFEEQDKPGERVKETHSFRFRIDFPHSSLRLAERFLARPNCLSDQRSKREVCTELSGILSEVLHTTDLRERFLVAQVPLAVQFLHLWRNRRFSAGNKPAQPRVAVLLEQRCTIDAMQVSGEDASTTKGFIAAGRPSKFRAK